MATLQASRPANYYASVSTIPDYVEKAIASLSETERLHFADDLITAMQGDDAVFLADTDYSQWLRSQGYDSLLSVLKWVTSELL
jgi:hypothetical protein